MPSLNEVTLMGHLGKDAETKHTPNGKQVTNFSIATNRSWKKGDEWVKETDWHNVVAWQVRDETLAELLKGSLVMVKGRLQMRNYENKEGRKVYVTEVVAQDVLFLRQANAEGPPKPKGQMTNPHGVEVDDTMVPF
jgi:single-strand DNA-binding protein